MQKNNDLKLKSILVLLAFVFAMTLSVLLNVSVSADPANSYAAAGSSGDPLITEGYMLKYINKVYTPQLSQTIDRAIADSLKSVNAKLSALDSTESNSGSYILIEMTKGQKLRAKSGTLELILRPGGTASVISDSNIQGIADLTSGDELLNGNSLPVNHSLLIPRADGRGIYITSAAAYVLVRGDYEIY